MKTCDEIREDLKEIRYYYSMQDVFEKNASTVKPYGILRKVEMYNAAIGNAPAKLYVVYVSLYVNNNSQTALADDWGFTREYIKDLNQMLIDYLQSTLNEKLG